MLIAPLTPTGLNTAVPQPPRAEDRTQPTEVVVTVRDDDSVQLNREPVALADLQQRLAVIYKNHPSRVLFVRGEGRLEFQQVARVIDLARGAGLERVALMPR